MAPEMLFRVATHTQRHRCSRSPNTPSTAGLIGQRRARFAVMAALAAVAAVPVTTATAQSRFELSPFASRNGSLDGSPILVGAGLTTYGSSLGGILGMRLGGAYDIRSFAGGGTTADAERGWVADADAVISPARFPVIGPLLGGFLPTVFSGIGVEGLRRNDGTGGQSVVTSYGAGVSRTLGGFSFETEARRRVPVSLGGSSTETPITKRGWEYRIGVSIGFGGTSTPRGGLPTVPFPTSSRLRSSQ